MAREYELPAPRRTGDNWQLGVRPAESVDAAAPRIVQKPRYTMEQISDAVRWYEQRAKSDSVITPWAILTRLEAKPFTQENNDPRESA